MDDLDLDALIDSVVVPPVGDAFDDLLGDILNSVQVPPTPAKAAPAKPAPAKAAPAKTAPATTAPAKAAPAKTTPAKTTPAKTTPAKTTPAKPAPAKTAPAKTAAKLDDVQPAENGDSETTFTISTMKDHVKKKG